MISNNSAFQDKKKQKNKKEKELFERSSQTKRAKTSRKDQ